MLAATVANVGGSASACGLAAGAGGGSSGSGTAIASVRGPIWPRAVRWTGTGVVCAWAAFWTWFCFNVAVSEGGQSWLYGGGVIVVSLAIAAMTVRWPRVGGVLAIGAGVFSIWFFPGAQAWMLMASPPIVGGLLAVVGGWMGRNRG